jgi:hypothetical protein
VTEDHVGHDVDEERRREGGCNPEPSRHVAELGVVPLGGGVDGLERHATLRAIAGPDLSYFRVHGAGVDRVLRAVAALLGLLVVAMTTGRVGRLICPCLRLGQIATWIGVELLGTARRAEQIRSTLMFDAIGFVAWNNGHAAHRISLWISSPSHRIKIPSARAAVSRRYSLALAAGEMRMARGSAASGAWRYDCQLDTQFTGQRCPVGITRGL